MVYVLAAPGEVLEGEEEAEKARLGRESDSLPTVAGTAGGGGSVLEEEEDRVDKGDCVLLVTRLVSDPFRSNPVPEPGDVPLGGESRTDAAAACSGCGRSSIEEKETFRGMAVEEVIFPMPWKKNRNSPI